MPPSRSAAIKGNEGTLNTVRNAGGVVTDDQQHPRILLRRDDWRA
jgi:hypothetical protein